MANNQSRVESDRKKADDILTGLLAYWQRQSLSDDQQCKLIETMRWSYEKGILEEAIQQVVFHRILMEDDEDEL